LWAKKKSHRRFIYVRSSEIFKITKRKEEKYRQPTHTTRQVERLLLKASIKMMIK
jgi:hypothetical protein